MIDEQADVLEAKYSPDDSKLIKLDELEPMMKVTDIDFYNRVITSLEKYGLRYPLVIVEIGEDEWREEAETSGYINYPKPDGPELRKRVQCGNTRFHAIRNHWPTIKWVECVVFDNSKTASELCAELRRDKTWKNIK